MRCKGLIYSFKKSINRPSPSTHPSLNLLELEMQLFYSLPFPHTRITHTHTPTHLHTHTPTPSPHTHTHPPPSPPPPTHTQVGQIERERALKWGRMIREWPKYVGTERLHRRANKGIPNSVRGAVWKHVLDIDKIKEDGVYEVRV